MKSTYICPRDKSELFLNAEKDVLNSHGSMAYPVLNVGNGIPNFLSGYHLTEKNTFNLGLYDKPLSVERYRNELNWLYETFGVSEKDFRKNNIEKLEIKNGQRILITGCGLGCDIKPILDKVGPRGEVYAQDLSPGMVLYTANALQNLSSVDNVFLSISDAQRLPFKDEFFDGVFHFGGLNLFDDIKASITEMARVTKLGGRVVFGDESVAPWLRLSDYGQAAICNNALWAAPVPLELLPHNATDVNLTWVFGNCFYLITFTVTENGPYMNTDVQHIGTRGGSIRTRYYGQLEGVSPELKRDLTELAKAKGVSLVTLLEDALREKIVAEK